MNDTREQLDQLKMCELRARGLMAEIDQRSANPTVVCGKCGAKADRPEYLHNPRPLARKKADSYW